MFQLSLTGTGRNVIGPSTQKGDIQLSADVYGQALSAIDAISNNRDLKDIPYVEITNTLSLVSSAMDLLASTWPQVLGTLLSWQALSTTVDLYT